MSRKLLFICSRNQWRSRTAEDIFKHTDGLDVRSAGTSNSARIKVSEKLIEWADLIFVMEKHHKQILNQKYATSMVGKQIIILDIPDEYQYMDNELIDILEIGVEPHL
jgi:predicted protein tyrosine phosphatase